MSVFQTVTIEASDAPAHPDAIRRLRANEIDALIVRNVYTGAECARIVARLEAGDHGLIRMNFPAAMRSFFLGMNLNLSPEDLGQYFAEAPRFHQRLGELFGPGADPTTRIPALLSRLDRDRPYRPAPGPESGQQHMFATLRGHLTGGFIPPHFDNEQMFRPSYRHVCQAIGQDLFSFVLAFSQAEAGGALEVFDMHHQGRAFRMADGPRDASHLDLGGVPSERFRLAPGEMILINSGRKLHRVVPVEGPRTRWTACAFMAESKSGDVVYTWG